MNRWTLRLLIGVVSLPVFVTHTPGSRTSLADDCALRPGIVTPQGSHWYYRVEEKKRRKCWYLASMDKKTRRAAESDLNSSNNAISAPGPSLSEEAKAVTRAQRAMVDLPVNSTTQNTQQLETPTIDTPLPSIKTDADSPIDIGESLLAAVAEDAIEPLSLIRMSDLPLEFFGSLAFAGIFGRTILAQWTKRPRPRALLEKLVSGPNVVLAGVGDPGDVVAAAASGSVSRRAKIRLFDCMLLLLFAILCAGLAWTTDSKFMILIFSEASAISMAAAIWRFANQRPYWPVKDEHTFIAVETIPKGEGRSRNELVGKLLPSPWCLKS